MAQFAKRITSFLNSRIKRKKILSAFKHFLQNGFYFFDGRDARRTDFSFRNLKNIFLVFSFKKYNDTVNSANFLRGTYKICFSNGKNLVSWCNNQDVYNMNKNNYLNFSKIIPFPFAKEFLFFDRKKLIVSEYVDGQTKSDRNHLILWAKKVLYYSKKGIFDLRNGVVYYPQHGDSWYNNIIWTSENDFKYIDLDRIGMWPAFYDVIYGFVVAFKEKAIDFIESELLDDMGALFESFLIQFSKYTIDIYFSEFIKIWEKRDRVLAEKMINPFSSIERRKYPLTYNLYSQWKNSTF